MEYAQTHPEWSDDQLFEASRRMVIALYQKITGREYAAALLGGSLGVYTGFNNLTDCRTDMGFAFAAMRFGHSSVLEWIDRRDEHNNDVCGLHPLFVYLSQPHHSWCQVPAGPVPMRTCLFRPQRTVYDVASVVPDTTSSTSSAVSLMELVYGLTYTTQGRVGLQMTDTLRNLATTGSRGTPSSTSPTATRPISYGANTDLASINILRGREVGLPTYNAYRTRYSLGAATAWSNVTNDAATAQLLASLYPDVRDCDLWVCGLAEPYAAGAVVGPTFRAIIRDQFVRWRDGDRFWYENPNHFTAAEIQNIRSDTLPALLARTIPGTDALPLNPFFTPLRQLNGFYAPLQFDPSDRTYDRNVLLHPIYRLSWRVVGDRIDWRVQVRNPGWVGLGFDPEGMSLQRVFRRPMSCFSHRMCVWP